MSWSFGFNIVICMIAVLGAWLDHGETWAAFKRASNQEKRRKLAKLFVVWGASAFSLAALPFTYKETIQSESKAHGTERIATTAAARVNALDPQEQSIAILSVAVKIETRVTSTNVWRTDTGPASRSELRFAVFPRNHKQIAGKTLVADKFEQYGSADGSVWYFVDFSRGLWPSALQQLPASLKVGDLDTLESLEIWAFFLPKGTEITGGQVIMTLNNSVKEYTISPKKLATNDFPAIILCSTKNVRSTKEARDPSERKVK